MELSVKKLRKNRKLLILSIGATGADLRQKLYFPKFSSKIELFTKRAFCQFLNFYNRSMHSKVMTKIKYYIINQTVKYLNLGQKNIFNFLKKNLAPKGFLKDTSTGIIYKDNACAVCNNAENTSALNFNFACNK